MTMHPDQLAIDVDTVRGLVDCQFPHWRSLRVRRVRSQGTVNALFRIGNRLAARLPLLPGDAETTRRLLAAEADAARELLGRTRFRTPAPVVLGAPGEGYPLPWSVQSWLPGTVASHDDPSRSVGFAHDLVDFIAGVRSIDVRGRTFDGVGRGGDLRSHDAWMQTCLNHTAGLMDVSALRRLWDVLRELPVSGSQDTMTHGDLIPANLLVRNGRLTAVIDVGGLGAADPALDLVCGWHALDAGPRQIFRNELHCDDLEWERGKAWAFEQAMGVVWYYASSNPAMSLMGRRTLHRITELPV